jgi:hypothetical protein
VVAHLDIEIVHLEGIGNEVVVLDIEIVGVAVKGIDVEEDAHLVDFVKNCIKVIFILFL